MPEEKRFPPGWQKLQKRMESREKDGRVMRADDDRRLKVNADQWNPPFFSGHAGPKSRHWS